MIGSIARANSPSSRTTASPRCGPKRDAASYAALGWSAAGFAATAVLALGLALLVPALFEDVGLRGAVIAVGVGCGAFVLVTIAAFRLAPEDRGSAQALLWAAVAVYAVLVNVFAAPIRLTDPVFGESIVFIMAGCVFGVGAAVLLILAVAIAIAIAIGFDDSRTIGRWLAIVAIIAAPVVVIEPQLWWAGIAGGFLLALAVDLIVTHALERIDVPEPALAACLVAAVSAVVLIVAFMVLRFAVRMTLAVFEGAIALQRH